MASHRALPLVAAAVAAGLCVAACSAGATNAGDPSGANSVSLGGSLGDFPLPPGATLVDNVTVGANHDLIISGVTPVKVSSFYTSALPQAGYTITVNNTPAGHFTGTAIIFTGHGYRGVIGAATSLNMSGTSGLTGRSGNEAGITLAPI